MVRTTITNTDTGKDHVNDNAKCAKIYSNLALAVKRMIRNVKNTFLLFLFTLAPSDSLWIILLTLLHSGGCPLNICILLFILFFFFSVYELCFLSPSLSILVYCYDFSEIIGKSVSV